MDLTQVWGWGGHCGTMVELASVHDLSMSSEVILDSVTFNAPKCLVYTNFPDVNPQFASHHLNDIYVARKIEFDQVKLLGLPHGTSLLAVGEEDFIPVVDGCIPREQVPPYWNHEDIPKMLGHPRREVRVPVKALLIARYGYRTWGHWLCELLPKIVCIEKIYGSVFQYVLPSKIYSDPTLRTVRQSLEYYGIDIARVVQVESDAAYTFDQLFCVSPVWTSQKLHPRATELMRSILFQATVQPSDNGKFVFLRTECATRNVANAAEILTYLCKEGFRAVELGNLDFRDQVKIFSTAGTILSVLGSSLSGLMYSKPHVKVATLAPSHWGDLFFFALMQERDARLADIRGVRCDGDPRPPSSASFVIDMDVLKAGLSALDVD